MENGEVEVAAVDAARALSGRGMPWFWLDGEASAPGERRVSYLGVASTVQEAVSGEEHEFLSSLGAEQLHSSAPGAGFVSGWIVALGYEFGVAMLGVAPKSDRVPPGLALRVDAVLIIDHEAGSARLQGQPAAIAQLRELLVSPPSTSRLDMTHTVEGTVVPPVWRGTDYEARVEDCREAIRRGDAYVLCLTDTAEAETRATPLELYERLRGGAVRGGVISVPGRALVSASPERFLSVRDGTVATHPIKGTRPRGATPELDAQLAAELASDPKERAENLMIVDLMRNDLARVCAPGSVRVERFLAVETHPRVHQLVSTVVGELREGLGVVDAIESCFPGGSMTGAPKRSAVEIIAGLEQGARGLYSGCFGWIDDAGDAELAMTIRGVELRGSGVADPRRLARALVGAGGGITIDSVPEAERRERDLKAAALLANL